MADVEEYYDKEEKYLLQLYVSGMTLKSMQAIKNIRHLCQHYLHDHFELEIIDLYKNPEAAAKQQIVFSPSLVKVSPLPRKTIIGVFADSDKVLKALGIQTKHI